MQSTSLRATRGMDSLGNDVRSDFIDPINRRRIYIGQFELDVLVKPAVFSENRIAPVTPAEAKLIIIAVPILPRENHQSNITNVEDASTDRSAIDHISIDSRGFLRKRRRQQRQS